MEAKWPEKILGDVTSNFDSQRIPVSAREREKRHGKYPYYGATGIMDYIDDYLFDGLYLLVAEDGSVETERGTPFLQLVDGRFWVNNHAHVMKGETDIDTRYLFYALSTIKIRPFMTGSVQAKLSQGNLNLISIPYPSRSERHAITAILGVLDDKIELSRQMNKTLEEIAQAVFKSWFVDFKPFRDKGMEDSPLGPIPRGWGVAQIGNLGDVICGKTPPTRDADNYEGHIPFITIPDMHDKVFVTQTGGYLTEKGAKTQPKKLLPRHAVCVSCIATPGLVALTSQPSHTNQQINSIICNDSISPFWCYLAMINLRHEIITGGAGGSATLNLNKNEFSKLQVIKPSQVVMWKFHQIVEPLFSRILSNELENIKLADIRDSLLPKLLSEEIRVKDAEKFVEVTI